MHPPILRDVPDRIDTERLLLRCPKPGDGQIVYEAVKESLTELRQFLTSVPWAAAEPSQDSSEMFCRAGYSKFIARKDLPFLVFERYSNVLVGCTGLHRPDWELPKFEVGYWARTSTSKQGYTSEAVRALVHMAERDLGAVRIEIVTDSANHRSRAVAERCGFILEATLVNNRRNSSGGLQDTCIYARTKIAA